MLNIPSKFRKPLLFGICGAAGCLIASFAGEAFLGLTKRPPTTPPQAVTIVIDTSGSMSGGKLEEVKAAATAFVDRQDLNRNPVAVVNFDSTSTLVSPLSSDKNQIKSAIASLNLGGSTRMDLGLDTASNELYKSQLKPNILLFTDGIPNFPDLTQTAAQNAKTRNINLIAVATGDADTQFLATLTGDPNFVFFASSGQFDQAFRSAEKAIYSKQLVESGESGDYGIIFGTLRIGGWTAILAVGISLALIAGQNRYLRRRLLTTNQATIATLGSIAAGVVAGSVGQLIFTVISLIPVIGTLPVIAAGGQLIGWIILGTLTGGGMSFFVPNLDKKKALLGGAIGGAAGGLGFLVITNISSAIAARIIGSAIIGFCIGIMIALLEILSRSSRLIVHWTPTESREILLGSRPIVLGSCDESDIYLRKDQGYPDVTAKIKTENDKIFIEFDPDYCQSKGIKLAKQELNHGAKRKLGDVVLEVISQETSKLPPNNDDSTI